MLIKKYCRFTYIRCKVKIYYSSILLSIIFPLSLPLDFLAPALDPADDRRFFSQGASHLEAWAVSPPGPPWLGRGDWLDWLEPVVLFRATDLFFPGTTGLEVFLTAGGVDTGFWYLTGFGPAMLTIILQRLFISKSNLNMFVSYLWIIKAVQNWENNVGYSGKHVRYMYIAKMRGKYKLRQE